MTISEYKKYLKEKAKKEGKATTKKKDSSKKVITVGNIKDEFFISCCISEGLPKPETEYLFAKSVKRKWRTDFFFEFEGREVAVEKEGAIWTDGRHTRGSGFLEDMKKYNTYSMLGIYLLRFSTQQIEETPLQCIAQIKQVLFCEKNIGKICELIKK